RAVAVEERGVPATLLLRQHVGLGVELGVGRDRAGLGEHLPALHVLALHAAQEAADVVAGDALVEELPEHLDPGHDRLRGGANADDLDLLANPDLAALDASRDDSAAAADREHVLDGHEERLVDLALWLGDVLVDSVHEFLNRAGAEVARLA